MNKVILAEELLEDYRFKAGEHIGNSDYRLMVAFAKQFAKLHLEAQTKTLLEKKTEGMLVVPIFSEYQQEIIINAYPLNNVI